MTDARALLDRLLALEAPDRERLMRRLDRRHKLGLAEHWGLWAHDGQIAPEGDWRVWVIMAGRGFGKTRAGAEWVWRRARDDGALRIALVGATIDDARRVMIEGESGLLAAAGAGAEWLPSLRLLRFAGGAEATLFSGASPDALRGPQHHIAWCDELAKWDAPRATWDMLQFGLRLGDAPRALITTTPRPGPVLTRIMAEPGAVVTRGGTHDNPHTARAYKAAVERLYAGTRLGRQEIDGELLAEGGALWNEAMLEARRVASVVAAPFARVVIGVDPPAEDGVCGIVACAVDADGIGHVLADHSAGGLSPEGWARRVADAAALHGPDGAPARVVAERNQGGKMVEAVLRAADPRLALKLVHASDGKVTRAQPVALLFEAGRVRLHGRFPELEAELCGMIAGGRYEGPGRSPDRADAMVWALTELMVRGEQGEPRLRRI